MSLPASAPAPVAWDLRRRLLRVLSEAVGRDERTVLVDFPNYPNVGDSAIWLGQLAVLRQLGVNVVASCDADGYHPGILRKRLRGSGKVLLQGGGNLGDEWQIHQELREAVVTDFPDVPVVQLPQSLHFNHATNLERARTVFDGHPDLTLLCRDPHSLELAGREFSASSRLCPDAAFGLGPLGGRRRCGEGVLWLSRIDAERRGPRLMPPSGGHRTADWFSCARGDPDWTRSYRYERELLRRLGTATRERPALAWPAAPALGLLQRRMAGQRLSVGIRLLSSAAVVVSDRLHAHILCLLLGIPHVIVDTGYGKIRPFVQAWSQGTPGVRLVDRAEEAAAAAEELLGCHRFG